MLKREKTLIMLLSCLWMPSYAAQQQAYIEGQKSFGEVNLASIAAQDLTQSKDVAQSIGYEGTHVLGDITQETIEAKASATKRKRWDQSTTVGDFLVDSNANAESQKVAEREAISAMVDQGQKVSDDPQKYFKAGAVKKTTTTKTKKVIKTCKISPDFEIKTTISLKYKAPERKDKETVLTIYYPEYVKNVGLKNDEIAPLGVATKNHQVNIERFRKYACPYFKAVDAVTKEKHKINCHRIKNFSLVAVVDQNRDDIVDRYGQACNPVRLIKISYKHDTYQGGESLKDTHWAFKTADMSQRLPKYNCALKKRECLDNAPRRFDELEVNWPCWEEELTYDCGLHINTCGEKEEKGCVPKTKKCLERVGDVCVLWEKTYECLEKTHQTQNTAEAGDLPFCWSGNCHVLSQEEDQDFGEVASKLNMLQDMQKNLERDGDRLIGVFKGEVISCNRHMLNFKDCCGSSKGWGVSLGLNRCSVDEQTLAKRRGKSQCHYVGTYCAEKLPLTGICVREKSVFCCFGSKLARVFQEKGRIYLGLGWGTSQAPNCRAFSVEEMKKIKWDRLDFSEVFSDVAKNIKPDKGYQKFAATMPTIQSKAKVRGHDLTA